MIRWLNREGIDLETLAAYVHSQKEKGERLNALKQWSDDNHEQAFHETIGETVRVEIVNVAL